MYRVLICLGILCCLSSCTDYSKVREEAYKKNNPHAKELLLHGFNCKASEYIDTETINRALEGDEEAKLIIYAQMQMLRGMPSSHTHVVPAPVIINQSRGR